MINLKPLPPKPPLPLPPPRVPHSDSEEPSPEELTVVPPDVEIAIHAAVPSIPAVREADAQAIITRAHAVGRPRQYTGVFDFVACSAM